MSKGNTMSTYHKRAIRLATISLLTATSLCLSATAHAECTDTNTCLGVGALPADSGSRNSAFGSEALFSNTSGVLNTAAGWRALRSNTTGGSNTAVGINALLLNTTGQLNAALGSNALQSNSIGFNNTALGASALSSNLGGWDNTAVGLQALSGNTGGIHNTAVGVESLLRNNQGQYNTASGYKAQSNHIGNYNTATGVYALQGSEQRDLNRASVGNTATGAHAMAGHISGYNNTGTGYFALYGNDDPELYLTGANNTANGANAMRSTTTGIGNTASGFDSLRNNTTGSRNSAYGVHALGDLTTGVRNVGLGFGAGNDITTGSDNIVIGTNTKGVPAENGVIRIGTGAYQKKAFIAGIRGVTTGSTNAVNVFVDSNGQLGTIKSSRAVKEDIQSMGNVSERLLALRPVTFRYKQANDDGSKPVQYGLIAEEVAQIFPELVVYDQENMPETVSYHLLATLLVNEFQKDHQQLRSQAEEIAQLKSQVAQMVDALAIMQAAQMTARNGD
jgi:trimeric autotransporter adhesin